MDKMNLRESKSTLILTPEVPLLRADRQTAEDYESQ